MEEINKKLELEENKLDSLDVESSNDDHVAEQPIQEPQEQKFKVGEQLIDFENLNIHFTNTTPERSCEMFVWLFQNLKKPPKQNPTYT